jgi:RimJ/RimL family protein N-acetyltransferase
MIPDPVASIELRSPRLTVRPLRREDLPALCGYRSRPEVARYQSWESFGVEDAEKMLEAQAGVGPGVAGKWFQFAIVVTETGVMAGDCGLHCRGDDPRLFEVGITLSPEHQRRGYAAEAIECVVGFAFASLGRIGCRR